MTRCRFLVDECVPSSLAEGLRRHLPDVFVLQVGEADAPPKGTQDPELLAFCEGERLILITADRATIPGFVYEHLNRQRHTCGVFVLGPDSSLSLILEELSIVYEASDAGEWIDVLEYSAVCAYVTVKYTCLALCSTEGGDIGITIMDMNDSPRLFARRLQIQAGLIA